MSHSEPAIRHATLALSSRHRHCELEQLPLADQEGKSALLYYSRAVSQAKGLLSQNPRDNIEKLLVLCVLFICYENMARNYPAAQMHLRSCLCILSESQKPSSKGQSIRLQAIPNDLLHTFSRIEFQEIFFSNSNTSYPFSAIPRTEPGPIPSSFPSVAEAQYHLFEHFKWRWVEEEIVHDAGIEPPPLPRSWLASRLTTWETSFAALQLRQREEPPIPEMEHGLVITQIQYEMFTIQSNTVFTRKEVSYDECHAKFERMMTLIDSLPLVLDSGLAAKGKISSQKTVSFEWGVIAPLFFIVVKCRDPRLRRQALGRLHCLHRREGKQDSLVASRIVERIIEIEEEGLENVQRAEEISNEKRVINTCIVVKMDQRMIFITCTLKSDPEGPLETKRDVIYFDSGEF
ncbi:hypothetical protein MMC22_010832 [Lobaria immixta]|nr:hypothetical protein [Lobaria immixta]